MGKFQEPAYVTLRAARARATPRSWTPCASTTRPSKPTSSGLRRSFALRPTGSRRPRRESKNLLADLADRGAQHADERAVLVAQVGSERANAERAIAAFSGLADRLDALAAANQRQPLLKRLKLRLVG